MDPDAALDELLDLADQVIQLHDHDVQPPGPDVLRMAELVGELDGWLGTGGFLPRRWVSAHRLRTGPGMPSAQPL